MKTPIRVLSLLLAGVASWFISGCASTGGVTSPSSFDVKSFGATGDGKTLDTVAINKAIEGAAAAGGGTVEFPAGNYLTFSIHLKSHVALHLGIGATIVAAEPPADLSSGYDAPEANPITDQYEDFGHSHWHNSLIWGENLVDIAITGPGKIFGRGLSKGGGRRDLLPEERAANREVGAPGGNLRVAFPLPESARAVIAAQKRGPFTYPGNDTLPAGVGNKAIALKNCRGVIFRDFTIYHGGHFGILATGVDNWTCDNLKIDTNRDGIDFDCCQNVRVANCSVNSPYDDGICPKASYGLGKVRGTENVTITNCQVSGYDEGTLLDGTYKRDFKNQNGTFSPTGRIKFGTESNGGFKNITVSNCVLDYSRGLALEAVDGALLEDVTITNITMRDISNSPIFLRLGARLRGPKETTTVGALRRVIISNVVVYNADPKYASIISGIPGHPIEEVQLSNIRIYSRGGGTKEQAALDPPEKEDTYPEPTMFGELPAYGFFIRHVKGLEMNDVAVSYLKDDARPAFVLNDVKGADFYRLRAQHGADVPTFVLKAVESFNLQQSRPLADTWLDRVDAKKF